MEKLIKQRPKGELAKDFDQSIHPVLQRVYAARGITSSQQVSSDISILLKPDSLKGINEAVARIARAVTEQQRILIVGDFDADGATSCALAVAALKSMAVNSVDFLVPNRFEYGYGLTPEIVEVAHNLGPDLIITVDNGISSISGVERANALGIDVVVTDHHLPGNDFPKATAIVNPNQLGCTFPSKNLAGVGVIFYVMSALRAHLRELGWFASQSIKEPMMANFLDLVALGTVADVVPLDQNNRVLVEQGLRRIRAGRSRPGINALLRVANRNAKKLVSADLGFAIGPRLNAAGRLDDMSLGIRCLLCDDEYQADEMAKQMDDLNRDRKSIEGSMQREALKSLQSIDVDKSNMPYGLCLYNANWHQGVIGILASRIKDKYHRPVIVFADADDQGIIKGSARSIQGLHIRDVLDAVAAKHPSILSKFGGHAMAAGMSIDAQHYQTFCGAFDQEVRRQLREDDLQAVLYSDGSLSTGDMVLDLAKELRMAGPWGQHFGEPLFDGVFHIIQQRIVGEKHLKLVLSEEKCGGSVFDAIAFNVDIAQWPNTQVEQVKIVYRLDVNEFRGNESVQLLVEYLEVIH